MNYYTCSPLQYSLILNMYDQTVFFALDREVLKVGTE